MDFISESFLRATVSTYTCYVQQPNGLADPGINEIESVEYKSENVFHGVRM